MSTPALPRRLDLVRRAACRPAILAALVALGGCKLIDQTTFAPAPEAKPAAAAAAATPARLDPRTPLAVIDFTSANPEYRGLLRIAVQAAESRDPRVQYDVIAVTPRLDEATTGQAQAAGVMRTMMTERVPAARIHLGLQTDPALTANQVRVYVR